MSQDQEAMVNGVALGSAAYWLDGQQVAAERFYQVACDPTRSVVVEACAGAGKTWMLVSRILRALLAGCAPQEVLAITFTKKAAAEMSARLLEWLRTWAQADAHTRQQELLARGVKPAELEQQASLLPALYGRLLEQGRLVEIHTFHGWFSRLLRSAPLELLAALQLTPAFELLEDNTDLKPAVWRKFLAVVRDDADLLSDYTFLVQEIGLRSTQAWLEKALDKCNEFELADAAGVVEACLPASQADSPWADVDDLFKAVLAEPIQTCLRRLIQAWSTSKSNSAVKTAQKLDEALYMTDARQAFERIWQALFTQQDSPRARLPESEDWTEVIAQLQALKAEQAQRLAHDLHQRLTRLTRRLLAVYKQLKASRGWVDMNDLERAALYILRDAELSAWVQERLDVQIKQVLIDEFQDTSPLQWQALQAWLSAYAGAGGGHSGQLPLSVFIVGDPKQSIYRFRRAEPRVFEAAQEFVLAGLGGHHLACDHTRRNAPEIIGVLNQLFAQAQDQGSLTGFRPHTTAALIAGQVTVLPAIERVSTKEKADQEVAAWRDSLSTPRVIEEESYRQQEAAQLALAIQELLQQGVAPAEIYILSRRRESLRIVAEALRKQHIPHVAPEEHALQQTIEARDVVAVLDALLQPYHDLSLAQALRSPLFAADDQDLMALARQVSLLSSSQPSSWWTALIDTDADVWADYPVLQRARLLLPKWRVLSQTMPPHDWLDRIVAEGQWRERLAAMVPAPRRALALGALDAVLSQALNIAAGRYLTPLAFVRALKTQSLSFNLSQQANAVQLLTVHGAKGLEAQVVFLVDTDAAPPRSDNYTLLIDWPAEELAPTCCAFIRSESKPPPTLQAVMQHEQRMRAREELNGLYVAMTRAKEKLIFSRIQPSRDHEALSWWQRLRAIPVSEQLPIWQPEPSLVPQHDALSAAIVIPATPIFCPPQRVELAPALATVSQPADVADDADALPEKASLLVQLGQAVHLVLERLTQLPIEQRQASLFEQVIKEATTALGLPIAACLQVSQLAQTILSSPELQEWLDPSAFVWAGNEVELSHAQQVLRLDRLVAKRLAGTDQLEWWILDYKLGHRPQDDKLYQQQLALYQQAVQALQPQDKVRTAFITGAGQFIEWVAPIKPI